MPCLSRARRTRHPQTIDCNWVRISAARRLLLQERCRDHKMPPGKDGGAAGVRDLDQIATAISGISPASMGCRTYISVVVYQRATTSSEVILLQNGDFEARFCQSGSTCDTSSSSTNDDGTFLISHDLAILSASIDTARGSEEDETVIFCSNG